MWRPSTLREAIDAGEEISIEQDRHGRYLCPNCGTPRHAEIIVDVRNLPIPEDWACDVCWTSWERTGRDMDAGGSVAGADANAKRKEWKRRWTSALGAPNDVVNRFRPT